MSNCGTVNGSWLEELRDQLAAAAPMARDRLFLLALPVFVVVYLVVLFAWLGWWGLLAAPMYLSATVALGVIIAPSEQSPAAKAALAVLVPAVCIVLLAALPKALGLI